MARTQDCPSGCGTHSGDAETDGILGQQGSIRLSAWQKEERRTVPTFSVSTGQSVSARFHRAWIADQIGWDDLPSCSNLPQWSFVV